MHIPLYRRSTDNPPIYTSHCEIAEHYIRGKRGDPAGGGDRLIEGPRFFGVVDAATEKSGFKWTVDGKEKTGEETIAHLLAQRLRGSSGELEEILAQVQNELQRAARYSGIDIDRPGSSPLAAFVLYDSYSGKLYILGDCSYGFFSQQGFTAFCNERVVDRLAAERRKTVIEQCGWQGAELDGEDPGREAIMPHLQEAVALANRKPEEFSDEQTLYGVPKGKLVYKVFDATSKVVPDEIQIPQGTIGLVLASDGYPQLFPTLSESEQYLVASLRDDPLRIGKHPSTKGVPVGAQSYDDRSYLRVLLLPTGEPA